MVIYATKKLNHREQAYDLLTHSAREVWGWTELPRTARTADGKPFFPGFPEHHFNLSHSGSFALCALDDAPIGVDIQIIKDNWREGLPKRVCSPEELEWLDAQSDRWSAFALIWTLKESRVKYEGTGLRPGVREISVPLPFERETLYRHDGLWFRIYTGEGWKAAACGEHEPPEELIWG